MKHPNDDTGDALRRLEAEGDKLIKARDIDFSVVFPSEVAAKRFAERLRASGYVSKVYLAENMTEFPWNVNVVRHMIPSHEEISQFEMLLQECANGLGGHNDGWGCFAEKCD